MSDTDNDQTQTVTQDELTALKARADLMGISYHPSIGLEKLREKVNAAAEGKPEQPQAPDAPQAPVADDASASTNAEESLAQRRARLKREASELVRIRVTCMNPAKAEWEGEIFTVGNSNIGSFKKFVPFNADAGWHVPRVILQQIKDRQCQIFMTKTDARGNKSRTGKLIKEFAVEILDPLTPEELHELAQRQAMAKSID